MATTMSAQPTFACDAMLGGLARWLRAAGYDASWRVDVGDWDLIHLARREGRLLLSSDTGIFQIGIVRDGHIAALFIPRGLNIRQQLAFVLGELNLPVQEPRCMACGGEIVEIAKEEVQGRVPTRTFAWLDRFWQCTLSSGVLARNPLAAHRRSLEADHFCHGPEGRRPQGVNKDITLIDDYLVSQFSSQACSASRALEPRKTAPAWDRSPSPSGSTWLTDLARGPRTLAGEIYLFPTKANNSRISSPTSPSQPT